MSRYIIKNCPCFFEENEEVNDYTCSWCGTEELACQDCTDCVMKQIVNNCRNIDCPCEYRGIDCWECSRIGAKTFADSIIRLLDIEEVE